MEYPINEDSIHPSAGFIFELLYLSKFSILQRSVTNYSSFEDNQIIFFSVGFFGIPVSYYFSEQNFNQYYIKILAST